MALKSGATAHHPSFTIIAGTKLISLPLMMVNDEVEGAALSETLHRVGYPLCFCFASALEAESLFFQFF